ncbi:SET domain-containing protein [Paraphaeosphaeria sporulosa]|uniref:SET domain-containing protein n=1 Tax=Paraphaeosphaeria sporulosa TaxID=1460663 RepID=A0A177CEB1_9PLEO|nr:SET domain-containing protein [Paraphaeosphaeria sporulosa]OAG05646.1 SET domain-containing protein [Paraphaeosphaeria sporulosa]
MGITTTTYSTFTKRGIAKRRSPHRGSLKVRRLRSRDRFFWLSASDGVSRLVNANNSVPEQVNDYTFAPSKFRHEPYPITLPVGRVWPPRQIDDLVGAIGSEHTDCVGDTCYNGNICEDLDCTHTLSDWRTATSDWETYFELRMTEHRGVGVYTKRAFRQGTILGWYSGELRTLSSMEYNTNAYLMEIEIGDLGSNTPVESVPTVFIDGEQKGNWTRFINHSCAADCVFRIMRVGSTRIMAVQAVRDIPRGKELSVDYGQEYYGLTTLKICACGVPGCVSRKRARIGNVKRCKRVAPPVFV